MDAIWADELIITFCPAGPQLHHLCIVANEIDASVRWAVRNVATEVNAIWADGLIMTFITFAVVVLGLLSNWSLVINANTMTTLVACAIIGVEAGGQLSEFSVSLTGQLLINVVLCQTIQCVTCDTIVVCCLWEGHLSAFCAGLSKLEHGWLSTNRRLTLLDSGEG